MHRTQIYLQNDLYEKLKTRATTLHVSISELIRRTLEKDIQKDPVAEAQSFFDRMTPLESFTAVDARTYVDSVRRKSRILRQGETA